MIKQRTISAWLLGLGMFLCAFSIMPAIALAGSGDEGSAAAVFLKLDPDARSAAYGSASIGRATHGRALHHNPAGLSRMRHTETTFTQFDMIADITYHHLSVSAPVSRDWGGLGLSATSLNYGDLDRTTINTNQNPVRNGNFGADDLSLTGSYGLPITDWMAFGLSYKYVRQEIASFDASTQSMDLGLNFKSAIEGLNFGLAARNIGGEIEFLEKGDPLPTTYGAGVNFTTPVRWGSDKFSISGDFVLSDDAEPYLATGLEYNIQQIVALRAGYNGGSDAGDGLTLGGGINVRSFSVDYAFVPVGDLGDHHRFTLSYKFGHWPEKVADDEQDAPTLRNEEDIYGALIRPRLDPSAVKEEEFVRPEQLYEWKVALDAGKNAYLDGNFKKARREFMKVYKLRPNFVKNLVWLGLAEHKLGMGERARERFYRALELDPNNEAARKNLERIN